ncbi:uncharacterized protein DEA37_0012968 [Paragonimus westermani]|uniref:Uncharacterized protein n=1 Tax=Paragonimus westermani TaxID=34504 RepID=A0A5J4NVZ1_9TREM|nr:uncharacterized protein DEA37_0012968 [Paragonimus westermani]
MGDMHLKEVYLFESALRILMTRVDHSEELNPIDRSRIVRILANDDQQALASFLKIYKSDHKWVDRGYFILFVDRRAKRTILHLAVSCSATRCTMLLVNPPYSYSPDQRDAIGWSPMHIAEARDDLSTLYELALKSRELRHFRPRPFEEPNKCLSTCVIWPQDLFANPLGTENFLQHTTRGTVRNRMPSSLHGTPATFACGHSFALIFEMFLANPDLCDFDLMLAVKSLESDRHSTFEKEVNFTLWPIRPVDPHDGLIHSPECRDYPHCLAEYLEAAGENNLDATQKFENLFQIWKFHRFRIDNEGQHPRPSVWSPLNLKAFCRMAIRRHMVNRTMPSISNSQNSLYYNYAYNVKSLRLPDNLQRFLLYCELWPSHSWTNVEVWYRPKRQRCIPCTLPRFGQGVIVKHSFIPD